MQITEDGIKSFVAEYELLIFKYGVFISGNDGEVFLSPLESSGLNINDVVDDLAKDYKLNFA